MHRLAPSARERAERYIIQAARPLERARLRHDQGLASAEDVLAALAAFANEDGGLGHGLEPDVRLPGSSAICTSVALQIMVECGAPRDHALVRGAVAYLARSQERASGVWLQTPPNVSDAPHAPWWEHNPDPDAQRANPRAELVGELLHLGGVDRRWLGALAEDVTAHAEAQHASLSAPDLVCYRRLVETPELPDALRRRLLPPLCAAVQRLFLRDADPDRWDAMGMGPLELAPTPDGPLADMLADLTGAALDRLIATQDADGGWSPRWNWGGRHPDAWRQAETEWRGILTLNALRHLAAYGRLGAAGGDYASEIKPLV